MPELLDAIKGCMVGAAIGDALGMPHETAPPGLAHLREGYQRPSRWHPNAHLAAGSYTDDTQLMIIVSGLFSKGIYSDEKYAEELLKLFDQGALRFPDSSVLAACKHLKSSGFGKSGISSTTAGCVPLAIPFALVYSDGVEMRERLVKACSVTHTHPAAHAAAISLAMLVTSYLTRTPDPLTIAERNARLEDLELGRRIRKALDLEKEGISLTTALSVIGNDITVYQTIPLAFFLIARYDDPEELLMIASQIGGNTDTIGFICGACAGARNGLSAFPGYLVKGLEHQQQIETLAGRLYDRSARKH